MTCILLLWQHKNSVLKKSKTSYLTKIFFFFFLIFKGHNSIIQDIKVNIKCAQHFVTLSIYNTMHIKDIIWKPYILDRQKCRLYASHLFFGEHNKTRESWSGDHRCPRIPNFEWGNERNETCDLSYNLFISWPSKIYKFLQLTM